MRLLTIVLACFLLPVAARADGPTTSVASTTESTPPLRGPNKITIGDSTFDRVVPLAPRYKTVEEASKVTDGNGIDHVYFKDLQTGLLYVAYCEKGDARDASNMREGLIGNFRGHLAQVVHVHTDLNTFWRGAGSVFRGTTKAVKSNVFDNFLPTLATGATGIVVASILSFSKGAAAETAAGAGAVSASGALNATKAVLRALRPVLFYTTAAITVATVGYAVVQGVLAVNKKRDAETFGMVSSTRVGDLNNIPPGPRQPGDPDPASAPNLTPAPRTPGRTIPRAVDDDLMGNLRDTPR